MHRSLRVLGTLLIVGLSVGCASRGAQDFAPDDPMEDLNRRSYAVSDWVDRNALVPVARGYTNITPSWWRTGVGNVFANLRGLDSSANGFLQGKPGKGATDFARFLINSTMGVAGIFDVAQHAGLQPGQEDFGQTLAVWGVKQTRYVYIPFLGPSTVRDLPSVAISSFMPRLILGKHYNAWLGGADVINARAQALTLTDTRDASALDPYTFTREAYYQRRKFLIYDGDPPADDFFDEGFDDEFADDE